MTHLGPYELNKVHLGDCIELMRALPDKCVDLTVTSPPYNAMTRVRGNGYCKRGEPDSYLEKYDGGYRDELPIEEYYQWQKKFLEEALRVTRNQVFYIIQLLSGNKAAVLKLIGQFHDRIKEVIVWDKVRSEPAISEQVLNSEFEFILVLSTTDPIQRRFWNGQFKRGELKNVWRIGKQYNNEHSEHGATFPRKLSDMIVMNFSGPAEVVLDPFIGTGTTGISAIRHGRRFLGFEIDPRWCELANKRIEAAKAQGVLAL